MSCYHPLKGFKYGLTNSGKDNYIITPFRTNHIEIHKDKVVRCDSTFISPKADQAISTYTEIPCGKCIGCRLDYSRQWANRCVLEMTKHRDSCFITLTYDDDHLHWTDTDEREFLYGEVEPLKFMTLKREDFTKFIKRLRKKVGKKISYFGCGEYGSVSKRPHLHIIIFGWKPDDLKFYKRSPEGYNYYNSDVLSSLWKYGYSVVGEANWETCAYTARYCMKKLDGDYKKFYEMNSIEPEFISMSLRPAIGKEWFISHNDYYANFSHIDLQTDFGSRPIYGIRYFDKLYEKENPEEMKKIKEQRNLFAKDKAALKLQQTTNDYTNMLLSEELNTIMKTKSLKRKEI